jgi:hypothetical protein
LEKREKWHLAIPQLFMVAKPIHNKNHFSKSESGCAVILEKWEKRHLQIPQVFMVAKPIHNKNHFSKSESGCALLWKNGKNGI